MQHVQGEIILIALLVALMLQKHVKHTPTDDTSAATAEAGVMVSLAEVQRASVENFSRPRERVAATIFGGVLYYHASTHRMILVISFMKLRTIRAGRTQSFRSGKNYGVRIEALETRIAPASGLDAIFSTGALMIADSSGAASDTNLTISLVGANIRITDPSQSVTAFGGGTQIDVDTVEFPFSSVTNIFQVDAGSGDDSLIRYATSGPVSMMTEGPLIRQNLRDT